MPQLDFLLSEKERFEFVKFAFKNECKIIPNLHYGSDKYKVVSDLDGYLKFCNESPLLFLINSKYSYYPLELDFFDDNSGNRKFFIKQRYGGPTIDFFSPIIGEHEEKIVGAGYIGIYPYYYHHENKITPNNNLKEMYSLFTKFIKKMSKEVKLTQRKYWVGNQTIKDASEGKLSLHHISGIDLLDLV